MTLPVLRTADAWYLRLDEGAVRIDTAARTTAELLADRAAVVAARSAARADADADAANTAPTGVVPLDALTLVSPITTPCRVVAQVTNYASHARDTGFDPRAVQPAFFRKASASVSGPYDEIVRPPHVRLLDYEVEIGLVIGRAIPVGSTVTATDLTDVVAALVVTNDVSARDVQLGKGQYYESKSYPGFTPTGPVLLILEDGELDRFADLRLRLWVDGELRQDMGADDMIHGPLTALRTLAAFQHLDAGDLVLTGTPVGTALSAPAKIVEAIGTLLPAATKWRIFFRGQARNPRYLQDGSLVEVSVATPDGALDLGTQSTKVRWAR
jgi:2-keto-4-pentenoate hydratase/2-oxohepta-3-ene-1,7-dioic acid hydratase in catechol pathway